MLQVGRASQLAIFVLHDEVTEMINVLFAGGKHMLQMGSIQAAHHRFSSSQECKSLVLCAAVLSVSLFVPLL